MNEVENNNQLQPQKSKRKPVLIIAGGALLAIILIGVAVAMMMQVGTTTKRPTNSSDTKKAISLNRAESANTAAKDLMKEAEKLGNDKRRTTKCEKPSRSLLRQAIALRRQVT